MRKVFPLWGVVCATLPLFAAAAEPAANTMAPGAENIEPYQPWKAVEYAIKEPLGELKGDVSRGRKLAINGAKGNCLACHRMPIPEEEFHGETGPDLNGVASRYNEGEIRLRIVNIHELNPYSLMPPFYKKPDELNQVAKKFQRRTILTAQEVEDVVAYLMTLK